MTVETYPPVVGERRVKVLLHALLDLVPGSSVLDVGCGTGDDTRELARITGQIGRVVGVDRSPAMIAESRRRARTSNLAVEYFQGEADRLDFPDASFDRCRADRLLMYVANPLRTVREMRRVVRPGGLVLVSDVDFGTLFVDSPDRHTTRRILDAAADHLGNGWSGRSLPHLLNEAGLRSVRSIPRVVQFGLEALHQMLDCHLTAADVSSEFDAHELETWWRELADRDRRGSFYAGCTVFSAVGRRAC